MSLDVSPALLELAQEGEISQDDFLACIRTSLPYAWELIEDLAGRLRGSEARFRR